MPASPIAKSKGRIVELGGTVLGGSPAEFGTILSESHRKNGPR